MKTYTTLLFLLSITSLLGCSSTLPAEKASEKPIDVNNSVQQTYVIDVNNSVQQTYAVPTLGVVKNIPLISKIVQQKAKTENLWHRIPQGYGLSMHNHPRIQKSLDKYLKYPPYFKHLTRNARPYLYHIVVELEKRGMPLEIALLPAIESVYNPLVLSPMHAAGIWQFIPNTGNYFGLTQDKWYDGRRDIIKSTAAALDYLQSLHKLFNDDWLLALAAYNYGQGNLRNAIARNQKAGRPTDFWSLKLPKETSKYVPKLLALAKIMANPQDYQILVKPIANKAYFEQINLENQMALSLAAKLVDMSMEDFKHLNPGYKQGVTAPKGPHIFLLPIEKVSLFHQNLAKIPAKKRLALVRAASPKKKQNVHLLKHKIRKGDTFWSIAQRYNTTVSKLRKLNAMKAKSLKVNKFLKVPLRIHTVKSGESLWSIARNYRVSVNTLTRWNSLRKDKILRKGQKLKILVN